MLKQRKENYEQLNKKLTEGDDKQISTVDEESRLLTVKDNIAEVSYNIQAVSDSKHSLIVEFDTVNESDQHCNSCFIFCFHGIPVVSLTYNFELYSADQY